MQRDFFSVHSFLSPLKKDNSSRVEIEKYLARVFRDEKFVARLSNKNLYFSLQFRCGKWRLDIGRRCRRGRRRFTKRGAHSPDTAPEKGELPLSKR